MSHLLPARWRVPLAMTLAAAFYLNLLPVALAESSPTEPQRLSLWSGEAPLGDGRFEAANASITVHRPAPEAANGAAIVICPGGGYAGSSEGY